MYLELESADRCAGWLAKEAEHFCFLSETLHKIRLQLSEKAKEAEQEELLRQSEKELMEICTEMIKLSAALQKISSNFRQTENHLIQVMQGEERILSRREIKEPQWREVIRLEKIRRILAGEKGEE